MSPSDPPPTTYALLRDATRGVMIVTLIALACASAVHFCSGCGPRQPSADRVPMTAEQSAILGMYAAEMEQCRERAVAARDIKVFDACADEVDRRYPR